MAKTNPKTQLKSNKKQFKAELDSVYFLKLVLYVILGSQWLWFVNQAGMIKLPIPLGLFVGLLFASHDHFKIDRKVEFAVLLIATLFGFATHYGVYITT